MRTLRRADDRAQATRFILGRLLALIFLWTALTEYGWFLPFYYCGLTWLSLHAASGRPIRGCLSHRLNLLVVVLAIPPPVAEVLRVIVCLLTDRRDNLFEVLVLKCDAHMGVLLPTLAVGVAWVHWAHAELSRPAEPSPDVVHRRLTQRPHWTEAAEEFEEPEDVEVGASSGRTALLCTLLTAGAVVEYNAFSVVYFSVAIGLMLVVAVWPQGPPPRAVARYLRAVHEGALLAFTMGHLVVACTTMALMPDHCVPDRLPDWLAALLGDPCGLCFHLQCVCSLAMTSVLYRKQDPGWASLSAHYAERRSSGEADPLSLHAWLGSEFCMQVASLAKEWSAELLLLLSLCLWALLLPTLSSAPIWAAALGALSTPSHRERFPGAGLAVVCYQAFLCSVHYAYAAFCHARGRPRMQWMLDLGLRFSYLPCLAEDVGPHLATVWIVGVMLLLTLVSAWAVSAAPRPSADRAERLPEGPQICRALLALRGLAVACVLRLAVEDRAGGGEVSWLQIGYLWWFFGLVQKYRSPSNWDVSQGDPAHWLLLMKYSGGLALGLLCWRATGLEPQRMLGLQEGTRVMSLQFGAHVSIACLAALQVQALQLPAYQPPEYRANAWLVLLLLGGQLAAVLLLVCMPPATIETFVSLFLLVAVALMGTLYKGRHPAIFAFRFWAYLTGGAVLLRSALMLPMTQGLLKALVPPEEYAKVWRLLSLRPEDLDPWREAVMVASMLLSWVLAVQSRGIMDRLDGYLQEGRLASSAERLDCAKRGLSCLIIVFACMASTSYCTDAISGIQLVVALLLLHTGQHWHQAGTIFTATSGASMLTCYLACFPDLSSDAAAAYWGMEWSAQNFVSSTVLVLLAVTQRLAHYCLATITRPLASAAAVVAIIPAREDAAGERAEPSSAGASRAEPALVEDRDSEPGKWLRLFQYDTQLAVVATLLLAELRKSAWSLAYLSVWGSFLARSVASQPLPPAERRRWMRPVTHVLMASMIWSTALRVWLPPYIGWPKPTPADVGKWPICSAYEEGVLRDLKGMICHNRTEEKPTCLTQQERCGKDWSKWLHLTNVACGFELFVFLYLCPFCWPHGLLPPLSTWRRLFGRGPPAVAAGEPAGPPGESAAVEASEGSDGADESSTSEEPPRRRSRLAAALGRCMPECVEDALSPLRSRAAGIVNWYWENEWCVLWWSAKVAKWCGLVAAFMSKPEWSLSAVGYLALLVVNTTSSYEASLCAVSMKTLAWPARLVSAYHFFTLVAELIFQCPGVPCPWGMALEQVAGGVRHRTGFISDRQCQNVVANVASEKLVTGADSASASVFFRCVGLLKCSLQHRVWGFSPSNLVIFSAALMERIAFAVWQPYRENLLKKQGLRDGSRADLYMDNLAALREQQMDGWETKKHTLTTKLHRLTHHLDAVRAIWDGRRAAFTEEEKRENARATRVESICLQSGVPREKVESLLAQFGQAASLEELETLNDPEVQRMAELMVDKILVEYLRQRDQFRLHRITKQEKTSIKLKLMNECKSIHQALKDDFPQHNLEMAAARALHNSEASGSSERQPRGLAGSGSLGDSAEDDVSMGPAMLAEKRSRTIRGVRVVEREEKEEEDEEEAEEQAKGELAMRPVPSVRFRSGGASLEPDPPPGWEPATELRQRRGSLMRRLSSRFSRVLSADSMATVSSCQSMEVARTESEKMRNATLRRRRQSCAAGFSVANESVAQLVFARKCERFIDDFLFIQGDDESLHVHLKGNSMRLLLWKCICSRTYEMLLVAAVLQFMVYRSVFAAVSVSLVVYSLSEFPHVPWRTMVFFHRYTAVVIIMKVLYQLPFCELNAEHCNAKSRRMLLLGLEKVDTSSFLAVFKLVFVDLLAYVSVLLNMLAARRSGRFRRPDEVLAYFSKKDSSTGYDVLQDSGDEFDQPDAAQPAEASQSRRRLSMNSVRRQMTEMKNRSLDLSRLRRPSRDFYPLRFSVALLCMVCLLFSWNRVSGEERSLDESLQANHFSGKQVVVLASFLVLVVSDRMLYSWYRYDEWNTDDARKSADAVSFSFSMGQDGREYRTIARQLLKLLVIMHLVILHVYFIFHDSGAVYAWSLLRRDNFGIASFYLCYLVYILISALQLKYDVQTTRGGFRCTHATDLFTKTLFRIYSALPFLHILRVLTDWTSTKTSLDFFMWMKLEDGHHSIYRTRCYMEIRALLAPGQRQHRQDKIIMGGLFLFVLLFLLIGPILWFSSLVDWAYQDNTVQSATLSVSLQFEKTDQRRRGAASGSKEWARSLNLYQGQGEIVTSDWTDKERKDLDIDDYHARHAVFQRIKFPKASDSIWFVSGAAKSSFAELLKQEDMTTFLVIQYEFECTAAVASGKDTLELSPDEKESFAEALGIGTCDDDDCDVSDTHKMVTVNATWQPYLHVPGGQAIKRMVSKRDHHRNIILEIQTDHGSLRTWKLSQDAEANATATEAAEVTLYIMSEKVPTKKIGHSIHSLYMGVVLVIGNAVRQMFKDSSKLSVVYDEIPNTDLLTDLCDGVYLARIQGNLQAEYTLYYELIQILRSPELLIRVGQLHQGNALPPPTKAVRAK